MIGLLVSPENHSIRKSLPLREYLSDKSVLWGLPVPRERLGARPHFEASFSSICQRLG